jgi:hypothetical protein
MAQARVERAGVFCTIYAPSNGMQMRSERY